MQLYVMSHFKINSSAVAQQGFLWLAACPSLPSFLETGISKDSMYLGPVPRCLSARAACGGVPFTGSHSVSSGLCYQVISDANAAWETRCREKEVRCQHGGHCFQGGCAWSARWHGKCLENVWSQHLFLQLRNVRHPPSGSDGGRSLIR